MDMQVKYEQSIASGRAAYRVADREYALAVQQWLAKHKGKLNGGVHYLVLGQPEISFAGGRVKYSRTADLCMRATSGDKQKVLKKDVVLFSLDWPNGPNGVGDAAGKDQEA